MRHERSQLLNDKDAIQIVYEDLVKTHNTLKEDHVRFSFVVCYVPKLTQNCTAGGSPRQSRKGRGKSGRSCLCCLCWEERAR